MKKRLLLIGAGALIAGCATPPPSGPSVMVLPGSSKTFDQFRFDDNECRQYAFAQIGGQGAADAQSNSAAKSAAVGTAVGAAAGALIGGSMIGTGMSESSGYSLQRRYDVGYQQCMYAKGHQIPMAARYAPRQQVRQVPPPPPPSGNPPPPPPGNPPAPPAS